MTTVVTSFGERFWEYYARRFVDSVHRHCPHGWRLVCYTDMERPERWGAPGPEIEFRPLPETVAAFTAAAPPGADGTVPQPSWTGKDRLLRHSYRTDALRFCHKPLALIDHAMRLYEADPGHAGALFWMDSDVLVHRRVPNGFLESCLGSPGTAVSRLHRPRSYSETGFLGFRLPEAKPFFLRLARLYLDGSLFKLSQWHDSWAIDYVISHHKIPVHDLVSGNQGNIWDLSPLQEYMVHLKGDLKHNHPFVNNEEARKIYEHLYPQKKRMNCPTTGRIIYV